MLREDHVGCHDVKNKARYTRYLFVQDKCIVSYSNFQTFTTFIPLRFNSTVGVDFHEM